MARLGERAREVRKCGGGALVIDGLFLPPDLDGLLEQRDRALSQALAAVSDADALQELRPNFGLQILADNSCRTAVQQLFGGRVVSLCCVWVCLREDVDEEGGRWLRPIALPGGRVTRHLDAVVLPKGDARDERETQKCRGHHQQR